MMLPPSLYGLRARPAPCLLLALLQLQCAGRCASQLLQAHGPEEEAEIRLCNASANVTSDCVTPHHGLLTALVAFLACLLFLMICSMALPLNVQDRLLRLAYCSCCRGARRISYLNAGLYKTRSAVCRPEALMRRRRVWGVGQGRGSQQQQQQQQQQCPVMAADEAASASAAVCAVPIRIEPAQEEAASAATAPDGACWTELRCQHPALVCDALFCYRSDPNIRESTAAPPRWTLQTAAAAAEGEAQRLLV